MDRGTIHISRALASCICWNSPDHSISYPSWSLAPVAGSMTFSCASRMTEARSRPRTPNLMGMNRRLFSR